MSKLIVSPIAKAIMDADKAESTAFGKCRLAAEAVFKSCNAKAETGEEYKRLMTLAKAEVAKAEYVIHGRNTWLHIGQHLLILMVPETEVSFEKGKGEKKVRTIKGAAECRTAAEVATAAKQIRESEGMSDGRASNKPKSAAEPEAKRASFWDEALAVLKAEETRSRLFDLLKAEGYVVTRAKVSKAPRKASVKASALAHQVNQQCATASATA